MAFKAILLCVSALLVQSILAQSCGCSYRASSCGCSSGSSSSNSGYRASSCGCSSGSSGSNSVGISNDGGPLIITSVGPIVPSGIAVSSDIALEGNLDVCGELPFLSAVAFEGCYPTSGSACVDYGCGDGCVGIQNVIGGGSSGLSGISGCGCGCN